MYFLIHTNMFLIILNTQLMMQNLGGFQAQNSNHLGQPVNKRTLPKDKVFYDCECGKRYDAFPGLYLHFKRKHNIKISSYPTSQRYKVHSTPLCRVITYFYTENTSGSQKDPLFLSEAFYAKFKVIIQEFEKGEKNERNEKFFSLIALDKFCLFLTSEIQKWEGDGDEGFFNKIPFSFNKFFLNEIENGSITEKNIGQWRNTLVSLSSWLNKKGYSEFLAIENETFVLDKK